MRIRKPTVSRPEKRLPLLTEDRGASLGYREHKYEQTLFGDRCLGPCLNIL